MPRLTARLGVVLIVLALALTGCARGAASPGTAAIVNGVVITEVQVTQRSVALVEAGADPSQARQLALSSALWAQLMTQAAANSGLTIPVPTQDEVTAAGTDQGVPQLAQSSAGREVLSDLLVVTQVSQRLDRDAVRQAIGGAKVVLNPKYGTWNPTATDGSYLVPTTGSLSKLSLPTGTQTP